jgi:UDP-2,4-diacetamido-2,4,6-trideoxy-beta-L-altropyranose hydrolase
MKKKIVFRADGNHNIGLGHLVRCLALAHMLKNDFYISFVCTEAPENFIKELLDLKIEFVKIKDEQDFFRLLKQNDVVVLDGYHFDTDYQKKVKKNGCKLICIDDLHDKEFYADLVINHAPGVQQGDYRVQPYTRFALGVDYVLLRPAFLKVAHKKRTITKIETVFVCFGGADCNNITKKIVEKLLLLKTNKKIIIVTGSAYVFYEELKQIVHHHSNVELYNNTGEVKMLQLMERADLAIVPSSGILFEALSAGCLVISSYYVDNQKSIFEGLKKLNAIIPIADFDKFSVALLDHLFEFKINKVIDGKSGLRLLKLIEEL